MHQTTKYPSKTRLHESEFALPNDLIPWYEIHIVPKIEKEETLVYTIAC